MVGPVVFAESSVIAAEQTVLDGVQRLISVCLNLVDVSKAYVRLPTVPLVRRITLSEALVVMGSALRYL